jgi:hypothetical protein
MKNLNKTIRKKLKIPIGAILQDKEKDRYYVWDGKESRRLPDDKYRYHFSPGEGKFTINP